MAAENCTERQQDQGRGIIIGGSGLIGGALVHHFKTRVENTEILAPNSKRLSLNKPADIQLYFRQYRPNFIINAAIAAINSDAQLAYETNYLGALNLAEVAIEHNIPYIHISSAATMPMGTNLSEEDRLPLRPNLPNYSKSKLMAELTLEHLARTRGLDFTTVRLSIVYGKHDHKIQGFHRLLYSIADQAMPILLTRKKAMHSYSNARKISPFVHHLLNNRKEFSGQAYNFADPEPVDLSHLILTIKALLDLKTPRKVYLPLPIARTGKNMISWFIGKLNRIGIEARMPGELMFLESFYKSQTLSTKKLLQSSYQDPQPEATIYSELPALIEYYLTRWEHLNLITTFNTEFYSPKNNLDDFKTDPAKLLAAVHKQNNR
ncbi:MAG TPA: SDR family oxidoreductase [Desulfobulbus sp.]|nr:SDR family oxidoreductase [Desulfobulbus sp.]